MTGYKKASYALIFGLLAACCILKLGPVLLAGLYAYMILDLTDRSLATMMAPFVARWLSVAIFLVTAIALVWMFGAFLRLAVLRLPVILSTAVPTIDLLAADYGIELPFENLHELRVLLVQAVKDNARSITATSGLLTHGAFQILIGVLVATACFLADPLREEAGSMFASLGGELGDRVHLFMGSYEKVLGAQVVISLINTFVTAIFIAVAGIPYLPFLALACFMFGVIPMIGSIASNAVIIGAALTLSPRHGLAAILFLVLSHRIQFLLGTHVIGAHIKTPMWATLLGILVGEAMLGVPGMILAPALIHYAREELSLLPAPAAKR